jgi:hypothetical protein
MRCHRDELTIWPPSCGRYRPVKAAPIFVVIQREDWLERRRLSRELHFVSTCQPDGLGGPGPVGSIR